MEIAMETGPLPRDAKRHAEGGSLPTPSPYRFVARGSPVETGNPQKGREMRDPEPGTRDVDFVEFGGGLSAFHPHMAPTMAPQGLK